MEKVIDCTLENEGFIGHFYPGTKETNRAIISVELHASPRKVVNESIHPGDKILDLCRKRG